MVKYTNPKKKFLLAPNTPDNTISLQTISPINTNNELEKLLYNKGPIIVSVNNTQWKSGNKGQPIWDPSNQGIIASAKEKMGWLNGQKPNHSVLLIGYGTNNSSKYWIIQNQWSSNWGTKGYCAIQYSDIPTKIFASFQYIELSKEYIDYLNKYSDQFSSTTNSAPLYSLNNKTFSFKKPDKLQTTNVQQVVTFGGLKLEIILLQKNILKSNTSSILQELQNIDDKYKSFLCWANKDNPKNKVLTGQIQDQGKCESCWVFTTLDAISAQVALNTNYSYIPLSVQYIIESFINNICKDGGAPTLLFQVGQNVNQTGLLLESACKYSEQNSCQTISDDYFVCNNIHNTCKTKQKLSNNTDSTNNTVGGIDQSSKDNKLSKTNLIILIISSVSLSVALLVTILLYIYYNNIWSQKISKTSILIVGVLCMLISITFIILSSINIL